MKLIFSGEAQGFVSRLVSQVEHLGKGKCLAAGRRLLVVWRRRICDSNIVAQQVEGNLEGVARLDALSRGRGQVVVILPVLVEAVDGKFLGHARENLFVEDDFAVIEHLILGCFIHEAQYDAGDRFPGSVLHDKRFLFRREGFFKSQYHDGLVKWNFPFSGRLLYGNKSVARSRCFERLTNGNGAP